MIPVTDAVKELFNPLDGNGPRYLNYKFNFDIIDENALDAESVVAQGLEQGELSRLQQILKDIDEYEDEDELNYITFENGCFPLDGSKVIPPRQAQAPSANIGYVSENLSQADCTFTESPTLGLKFNFSQAVNMLGFTVDFAQTILEEFEVDVWRNGEATPYKTISVTDNDLAFRFVVVQETACTGLFLRPIKTKEPFTRFRVSLFYPGILQVFDKSNTNEISVSQGIDILGERIDTGTLRIKCPNFGTDIYEFINPEGIFRYFKEYMAVRGYIGASDDPEGEYSYIPVGRWYVNAPSYEDNFKTLIFEAIDAVGMLTNLAYLRVDASQTAGFRMPLNTFLAAVSNAVGVNIIPPGNAPDGQYYEIVTAIPYGTTLVEILSRIAQMTNCVLIAERTAEKTVKFVALNNETGGALVSPCITFDKVDVNLQSGLVVSDEKAEDYVKLQIFDTEYLDDFTQVELCRVPRYAPSGAEYTIEPFCDKCVCYTTDASETIEVDYTLPDGADLALSPIAGELDGNEYPILGYGGTRKDTYLMRGDGWVESREFAGNINLDDVNGVGVANELFNRLNTRTKKVAISYRGYPWLEAGDVLAAHWEDVLTLPDFVITRHELSLIGGGMTGTIEGVQN